MSSRTAPGGSRGRITYNGGTAWQLCPARRLMEAYSNVAPLFNLPAQLSYSVPGATLDQVRPILRHRNRRYKSGRGVKRRDAAELNVRDVLAWLRALLHEQPFTVRVKRRELATSPGLYTRLGRCAPGMLDMRRKIRAGVSWLVEHGPASGWGQLNPVDGGETKSNFTPYYIGTRQRAAAERWVRIALRVAQLVRLFAALLSRVRPAPRGPEAGTAEPSKALPVPAARADYRYGVQVSPPTGRGAPPPHRPACDCRPCQEAARFLAATRARERFDPSAPWFQRALARGDG